MYAPYVGIIVETLQRVVNETTGQAVPTALSERAELNELQLSVAQVFSYQNRKTQALGGLVLGLPKTENALSLAAALARKDSHEEPVRLDSRAVGLLSGFFDTAVNGIISRWNAKGIGVFLETPSGLEQAQVQKAPGYMLESYEIILKTAWDRLIFMASFCEEVGTAKAVGAAKVLVAEDAESQRMALKNALGGAGYEVTMAADGLQAVEKYREVEPDLVLMDLKMPNLGGLDAMAAIREEYPKAKFIVLTSSDRRDDVVTATTLGVLEYMIKPMETSRLLSSVAKALAD